jgi:hypothetical protein
MANYLFLKVEPLSSQRPYAMLKLESTRFLDHGSYVWKPVYGSQKSYMGRV